MFKSKVLRKLKIFDHGSPANAKSLFKIHFGHENVICWPIFKIFAGPIATNWDEDADKKIFSLPSISQKLSQKIQYQTSDFTLRKSKNLKTYGICQLH